MSHISPAPYRASTITLTLFTLMLLSITIPTPAEAAPQLNTLVNFDSTHGANSVAGLIQDSEGNLYGTTQNGGSNGAGGTVFKLSTAGVLTTLVNFNRTNGAYSQAGPIEGSDGNFYGTTSGGGAAVSSNNPYGDGTVFKLSPAGVLTTLVNFTGTNGIGPKRV